MTMSVEKILVDHFDILIRKNQIGIELPLNEEKFQSADFLYDGRNCAILIRNNAKAFILTNIAYDLREKLLNADPLFIIESLDKKIYNAYPVKVTKINIPFADNLQKTIRHILDKIAKRYGNESLDLMVKKLWPENTTSEGEK
jgi:hypothetical protein